MSATIIDELMITLGLDGSKAKSGMKDVESNIKGSMTNIKSTLETGFASITKIFTGFGAALMGAFSVGSAFSTWKEQAAELGAASRRLHMSMEDLQGWTGAIGKFGGTTADLESSLRGLNGQLARMATLGHSRAGTLLESLGIDAGEIGRQRNALDVLTELAGVMEQMAPDEARGIGAALGLDPSTIMLLQQGRDGMKDLIRQKKEDAVYTQEDADAIKAYNVEMSKVKKGFMGIMGVLFRAVMPGFTEVTKYLAQFVNFLRKHQTAVKAFFTMVAALVTGLLLPAFMTFFRALLRNPITWLILLMALLALAIDDLVGWMEGKESEFGDFWAELFGSPEEAKATFDAIKNHLQGLWNAIKFVFVYIASGKAFRALRDNFNTNIQLIKDRWNIFVRDMGVKWERFKNGVKAPFIRIGQAIDDLQVRWNIFMSDLQARWDAGMAAISETWEWIKNKIAEGWQWIKDKATEAINWIITKWNEFKTVAVSALTALLAPIAAVAAAIHEAIGGAIDWAIAKWEAFKATVAGGSVYVNHETAGAAAGATVGAAISHTTNSSSVNINGPITVRSDNPESFASTAVGWGDIQRANRGTVF